MDACVAGFGSLSSAKASPSQIRRFMVYKSSPQSDIVFSKRVGSTGAHLYLIGTLAFLTMAVASW
jgi:hypothetical protein